jgi:hypothetical protein
MESSKTGQPIVKRFQNLVMAEIVLLFAQFQMGMSTNLYTVISTTNPWSTVLQGSGIELLLHIWNGMAILIISAVTIVVARRLDYGVIWKLVIVALALTGLAIFAGFEFFLNGQDNSYSSIMAGSFLTVYTLFFVAVFIARKKGENSK